MKYAGLLENDFVNGIGVCVSVWVQGCPFHCKGCHNPQTWDPDGGLEISEDSLIIDTINAIQANGLQRNLSILGGEPLSKYNRAFVAKLIKQVKLEFPTIKIFCWTGYDYDELLADVDDDINYILHTANYLMTGRFILSQRDVSLKLVGSTNQKIINLQN